MRFKFYNVYPEDIDKLEAKKCYSIGELHCSKEMVALSMAGFDSLSVGFGFSQDRLVGIAGSYRQWAGAAQIWAVLTPESEKYPIALRRACLQLIGYAVDKQELRRVSITVKSEYTNGNRFARSLGFELEGKMRAFLPDATDANLYSRLF